MGMSAKELQYMSLVLDTQRCLMALIGSLEFAYLPIADSKTENFGASFSGQIPDSVLDQVKKIGSPRLVKDGIVTIDGATGTATLEGQGPISNQEVPVPDTGLLGD